MYNFKIVFLIILVVPLLACGSLASSKHIELNGRVIDNIDGNGVENISFTILKIERPKFSNAFVSEKIPVASSVTSYDGYFNVIFDASWKFAIEADAGKFCHSMSSESRYFDVSSFQDNKESVLEIFRCLSE